MCVCVGQIIQYEPAWYICIHIEEREGGRARARERERETKGGGGGVRETETETETEIVRGRDGTVREIDCKIRFV